MKQELVCRVKFEKCLRRSRTRRLGHLFKIAGHRADFVVLFPHPIDREGEAEEQVRVFLQQTFDRRQGAIGQNTIGGNRADFQARVLLEDLDDFG